MATSPEQIAAEMIANLKSTTGKSLDEWIAIVSAARVARHGEIVSFLKAQHGVGHGYATMIAHKTLRSDATEFEGDALIVAQYAAPKPRSSRSTTRSSARSSGSAATWKSRRRRGT